MNANGSERMCGAVNQNAFDAVMLSNMAPEGIAAAVAFLRAAEAHDLNDANRRAILQARWLANTLVETLGGDDEYDRLIKEIGL